MPEKREKRLPVRSVDDGRRQESDLGINIRKATSIGMLPSASIRTLLTFAPEETAPKRMPLPPYADDRNSR